LRVKETKKQGTPYFEGLQKRGKKLSRGKKRGNAVEIQSLVLAKHGRARGEDVSVLASDIKKSKDNNRGEKKSLKLAIEMGKYRRGLPGKSTVVGGGGRLQANPTVR